MREPELGWLVIGFINGHFPHPDDWHPDPADLLGNACCVRQCGPCGALHLISCDPGKRAEVHDAVTAAGYGAGWCFWDDERGTLRWDWFELFWAAHRGCQTRLDGTPTCIDDDDDDDDDEAPRSRDLRERGADEGIPVSDDVENVVTHHGCPDCGTLMTVFEPPLEIEVRATCGATWRGTLDPPTVTVTCYLEPHPADQPHEGDAVITHTWYS